jgi:hypothetical protein
MTYNPWYNTVKEDGRADEPVVLPSVLPSDVTTKVIFLSQHLSAETQCWELVRTYVITSARRIWSCPLDAIFSY